MMKLVFMRIRINNPLLIVLFFSLVLLGSCKKSKYAELVKRELDKNIVNDSLIFGLKLGDPQQRFFDICWQLNKDKVIRQGPKNDFVMYKLPTTEHDSVQNKITLLFYGIFNNKKVMTGLDMKFYYDAWSLWNESFHASELIPVVQDTLMSWYPGNDFIEVTLKKSNKKVYVKVDGNRQILIESPNDTREVDVRIDDLRFTKGLN